MSKITVRLGVFETNSSSVHTMTLCTPEEWDKFKSGELLLRMDSELVPATEENKKDLSTETYEEWDDDWDLSTYVETKKVGDQEIIAFGKTGYDG